MNDQSAYYTDLIARYFSGEITEEELRMLSDWLKSDSQNTDLFNQYRKTWQLVEKQHISTSIQIDKEWKALQLKMNAGSAADAAEPRLISLPAINRFSFLQKVWKAAAVVIVLLASSFLLYYYVSKPGEITVTAQAGNTEQVLPDGSVISLHKGSRITYPAQFAENSRKVTLRGEAYFKVTHDKSKPFIVASGDARVEVLGTQFNINTQADAGAMEVVLTKGKVSVYYQGHPVDKVILLPGEKAVLSPDQESISKSTNTDANYMAWKTRMLVFDNQTLAQVVSTLQEVYQVKVTLADPQLAGCRVTATFNDQSLGSVLQVLKETLGLQITSTGDRYEISGKGCN